MAVHGPEEDRLSRLPGAAPGFPQVGLPRDLPPAQLLGPRLDGLMQPCERLGLRREQRYFTGAVHSTHGCLSSRSVELPFVRSCCFSSSGGGVAGVRTASAWAPPIARRTLSAL